MPHVGKALLVLALIYSVLRPFVHVRAFSHGWPVAIMPQHDISPASFPLSSTYRDNESWKASCWAAIDMPDACETGSEEADSIAPSAVMLHNQRSSRLMSLSKAIGQVTKHALQSQHARTLIRKVMASKLFRQALNTVKEVALEEVRQRVQEWSKEFRKRQPDSSPAAGANKTLAVAHTSNSTTGPVQSIQNDIKAMFKEQVRKFQAVAVKSLSKQVKQTIKKHLSENPKGDIKKLVKEELIKFKTTTAKALVQKAKGAIKRLAHQTLPKLKRKLQAKYAKLKTQAVKGIKDRISKLKRFKNTTLRRLKRNAKRLIQRAKGLFRKQVHGSQSKANTTLSTSTSSGHQRPCSIDQALIRLRMAKLWSVMYDVERSAAIRARHSVNAALNSISSIHSQLTARYNTTAQPHNAAIERSAKATPRIGWTTTAVQSDVVPAHKPTANATSSEIQAVRSTGIASTSSELSLPTRTTPVVIPTTDGAAA